MFCHPSNFHCPIQNQTGWRNRGSLYKIGHTSAGVGPREPARSQSKCRWKTTRHQQPTRKRCLPKLASKTDTNKAAGQPCSQTW